MPVKNRSVEEIISIADKKKKDRANWESWWDEVIYYTIPSRDSSISRSVTSGEKLPTDLYDSSGIWGLAVFAAGIMGYLVNPSTAWFGLKADNPHLMKKRRVKEFFQNARDIMLEIYNGSNFYHQMHELIIDFGSVGTGNFYREEDDEDTFRYYARHVSECVIGQDHKERVNEMYRFFEYYPTQAYEKWGEKCGPRVKELMKGKQFNTKVKYLHATYPRRHRDRRKKSADNKAYASQWIEVDSKTLVHNSGYDRFPWNCPRASKTSGNVYGHSQGMFALADMKMINQMSLTTIRGAQKEVDKPQQLPYEGFLLPLNMDAGGYNYRLSGTHQDIIRPVESGNNIGLGLEMEDRRREIIHKHFFVDMFLALTNKKNMSATEVVERVAEKMLIAGPSIGRLTRELLAPTVENDFLDLLQAGKFGQPPVELSGSGFKPEFTSPLAKAQRSAEAGAIKSLISDISLLVEAAPHVLDNIDPDRVARRLADIYGVPVDIITDEEQMAEVREQRAQAQQQAQEQQNALVASQIAEQNAKADNKEADTVRIAG